MTFRSEGAAALTRTADWLEANPERHITGDLARGRYGYCLPTDPEAKFFCAVGRLAREAGIQPKDGGVVAPASLFSQNASFYHQTRRWLMSLGFDKERLALIYNTNDNNPSQLLSLLRSMAAELERP